MTKSQKMRLDACNKGLLDTIEASIAWYDREPDAGVGSILLAQIDALKKIQVVLGGVVDES